MRKFFLLLLLVCAPKVLAQPSHEILADMNTATGAGFEPMADGSGATAHFLASGSGYTVRVLPGEIQLSFDNGNTSRTVPELVRISLSGANRVQPQLLAALPGLFHYYPDRDPRHWRTNVRRFQEARLTEVYPGIDLLLYSRDGHLEFDFNVAPGRSASDISLRVQGGTVRESQGNLLITTQSGKITLLRKPELYQLANGKRRSVAGGYQVRNQDEIAFFVGAYDRKLPLVIDPALIYSTIVSNLTGTAAANGDEIDSLGAIAVDAAGAAYVSGIVNDTAFVSKFNAGGTAMLYTTFLGTSFSREIAITVDAAGNAYMVGIALGANLPVTAGAFSSNSACFNNARAVGDCDAPFAVKLDPQGKIVYCTYLVKENAIDTAGPRPASIAVDATGALYIAGGLDDPSSVHLTPATMPGLTTTPGAFQTVKKSNSNLFAMKLHPDGSTVDYATFIGGSGIDRFGGMVIDPTGVAYITGGSTSTDFPTTAGAFQSQNAGSSAIYLKLKNDGSGLLYSTFLGAAGTHSSGLSIALDSLNAAYIDGETDGPGFPTTPGVFRTTVNGPAPGPDGLGTTFNYSFLSKFDPAGNLAFATYVGDAVSLPGFIGAFDAPYPRNSLGVDSSGVYMVGSARPPYPTLHSISTPPLIGASMFVTKMNLTGTALVYSTFFGSDQVFTELTPGSMALDGSQNVYVAGVEGAFAPVQAGAPTTDGAFQTVPQFVLNHAASMSFVAKVASSLGAPVPVPIPRAYDLNTFMSFLNPPPVPVQLSNFGDADLTLGPITITGPNASDFTQTNNCPAVLPSGGECLIQVNFTYAETSAVNRTATMTIAFGGGLPSQTVSLSAPAGSPNLELFLGTKAVTSFDFGAVAVGSQATVTLGLFDPSPAPAVLLQILASGDFSTPAVSKSVQLPSAPSNSPFFVPFFAVPVTFKPSAPGARTGQLIVQDTAFNSPHIVQLTGTGVSDFSLQPAALPASFTVTAGGTATYALLLSSAQGFSGSGSLTCSGLPAGTTCTPSPASFTFSGTALTQNISVNVTTTGTTASTRPVSSWNLGLAAMIAGVFLVYSCTGRTPKLLMLSTMVALCLAISACGGNKSGPVQGPPGSTPPGTFVLTITATSGSTQRVVNVTLQVL
jgi:hypothetical protein